MGLKDRPQCYFDVEINREPVGRIVFQLFSDVCPKTCKNFLWLCTGEKGIGKTTGKKLCYKGSTFHRVVKNFMIQGGDFTEGNGRGGESIYGGYFEDENFVLKHDRAFLLSMANRGKDTNGSQFFITTKTAPHLDGVHVVFGLIISGFEVIKQIENLKTDAASRPYADVRVIDCGQLITKSANDVYCVLVLERKQKISHSSNTSDTSSESSSPSLSSSESDTEEEKFKRRKRKRRTKHKHSKKVKKELKKRESVSKRALSSQRRDFVKKNVDEERINELIVKREKPVVRPEEIPPVPENRFLLRRDMPVPAAKSDQTNLDDSAVQSEQKPTVTKSGRKVKGRGTMRYHTPPRSRSHSKSEDDEESSETPPHWKEEMQRTKTFKPAISEKWSKGDKLNEHFSSKWDDRSAAWSRSCSRSLSHDYYSDHSNERNDQHSKHKKEKKRGKHKKKTKKPKHSKRQKVSKTRQRRDSSVLDEGSSYTSSKRSKVSGGNHRRSRSSTLSSRPLSRKDWSGSDKIRNASLSSRSFHSYTRSKSRSRSYSTSRSRSRSRTASRSKSKSRSRSRSVSRTRKRRSSKSPRYSRASESSKSKIDPPKQIPQNNEKVVATAVTESVPVLPLSDSPPPSRWKPGQKPWKPSYVRIQEIKAKPTTDTFVQTSYAIRNIKEHSSSLYHKSRYSDSERSDYSRNSDRSYRRRRSRSRSSRSRSYSRSYTRSKSRSRSSSASLSPFKYKSHSSCSSRSNSYDSYKGNKTNKSKSRERSTRSCTDTKESSPEGDQYEEDKSVREQKSKSAESSSEYSSDGEHCTVEENTRPSADSEKLKQQDSKSNKGSIIMDQQKEGEPDAELLMDEQKSKSGWDSDSDDSKKPTNFTVLSSELQHMDSGKTDEKASSRKEFPSSKWDSESGTDAENKKVAQDESRCSSGKEEGEASSDTDTEDHHSEYSKASKKSGVITTVDTEGEVKKSPKLTTSTAADGSGYSSGNEKVRRKKKSKHKHKHKKRRSTKYESERGRTKSKNNKTKKKIQRPKETFHWQPPLEFGEEEEEDDTKCKYVPIATRKKTKESKAENLSGLSEKNSLNTEETTKTSTDSRLSQSVPQSAQKMDYVNINEQLSKQVTASGKNPKEERNKTVKSVEHNIRQENMPKAPAKNEPFDDCMELCTSEQNSPSSDDLLQCTDVKNDELVKKKSEEMIINKVKSLQNTAQVMESTDTNASTLSSVLLSNASGETTDGHSQNEMQNVFSDPKWKPLKGLSFDQLGTVNAETKSMDSAGDAGENKPQGLRIEIKSTSKVRPGSLFDEVRKTARMNQRQRNQDSSSEERSPSGEEKSKSRSRTRSRSKSRSASSHRTRSRTVSVSYSRSRSRSYSYSYRSRSYSRSHSRRRYSRDRSRSLSSTYRSYRSRSSKTGSKSRSRSRSYERSRRSRSYTYDSYYSRSRSHSSRRSRGSYRKSRSYGRRSRSYRSYTRSDRSYSKRRSCSETSRYS
ncbi:NK-tumor recognition protein isoform X3 [Polypterus senegalus]|nr:NK-tumor recognition protein isoform X3 [Polypterus senegalus]XP_039609621.1 NK-tumor recognition protein isoform X3 [Polypterus senegalus]XP_039609622.1 NK-tumor recognition protein isoform X3 [Polypterus senegalus]